MYINDQTMVSISEANQNFTKVAKMTDEKGSVVIMKNNVPKYVILPYQAIQEKAESAGNDPVDIAARKVLERNFEAFKILADK